MGESYMDSKRGCCIIVMLGLTDILKLKFLFF